MAKPPQRLLETEAEYDWRMAVDHPDRYPFDFKRHADFWRRRRFWSRLWRIIGEATGIWRPFLAWARRADLLDRG